MMENWIEFAVTKKEVLDFCWVLKKEKSIPFKEWEYTDYEDSGLWGPNWKKIIIPIHRDNLILSAVNVNADLYSMYFVWPDQSQFKPSELALAKTGGLSHDCENLISHPIPFGDFQGYLTFDRAAYLASKEAWDMAKQFAKNPSIY